MERDRLRGDVPALARGPIAGADFEALGIDRKTIRKYLAPAMAEGMNRPGEAFDEQQWRERIGAVVPGAGRPGGAGADVAVRSRRTTSGSRTAEGAGDGGDDRAAAARRAPVSRCRSRRYVVASQQLSPSSGSKSGSPCRAVRSSRAVKRRSTTAGWACGLTRPRAGGSRCGRSRWCCRVRGHLFVRPVLRMDQASWNASHVAAFEFFGGVPARLVCDNLKTGVDKPGSV